jgi:hypothetical protein
MKKLILISVIFSLLILVGCENNSNVNPVSSESINKTQPSGNEITRGDIPLNKILVLPGLGNEYYELSGKVHYTDEVLPINPQGKAKKYDVKLGIDINAKLTDINSNQKEQNEWYVTKESDQLIYVSEEGIYLLEKVYPVSGRNDGLDLVCTYLVTTDGVGLSSVKLVERPH